MRVLNAFRRLLLLLVLIPVVAIVLDTLLRMVKAQRSNPIVSAVRDFANIFLIEPFQTVLQKQSYLQTAIVALIAFGVLALLIVFIFRGLRAMMAARPPKVRKSSEPTSGSKKNTEAKAESTSASSDEGKKSSPTT